MTIFLSNNEVSAIKDLAVEHFLELGLEPAEDEKVEGYEYNRLLKKSVSIVSALGSMLDGYKKEADYLQDKRRKLFDENNHLENTEE